ncbi:hypothetical protein GL218_01852 [Daldinia childiae]|uniref:uncharacterized protein n=1 Tax=Daldinia childiae TaxID=326645 RepID=UPI001446BF1F|nr:uncharacterized protein GL218_01852 [Daldinia childiae]KAF3064392.1 hypothetical protein GL218_01852 [Daldinia childiae]
MKYATVGALASVAATAAAQKTDSTFAVLHFTGQHKFLTEGPIDPVVNPGTEATHYHSIMGGSNFGISTKGDDLLSSECTTTTIKNDKSNYWVPSLFFQDPKDGSFEKVPLFYMNVYYFFEPTNSTIEPFPVGLKMLSGDTKARDPPKFGGGGNVDPTRGPIQPVQWTCPRQSYDPPSYPVDSDGTMAGLQDPQNQGAGAGFPLYDCDGTYSPLRQDIHFPSCYNPEAGLDDYKNNMAWPTPENGLLNCPAGWIHVPHLFYEVYWDTPSFKDRWTPDGKTQPFVLSNGDATGYSSHGDFISGWDQDTLKTIIDTCNVGTLGMENCPDIPGGVNDNQDCTIEPAVGTMVKASQTLKSLPLNCPVTGWGKGSSSDSDSDSSSEQPATSTYKASSAAQESSAQSSTVESGSVPSGNAFIERPSSSTVAAAPVVTAAAVKESSEESDPNVDTVWDVVYVTETTTVQPEATPVARRRRAPLHGHGHIKRHQHNVHGRR